MEMEGRYTLSDISARYGSADKEASERYLAVLRGLIDDGTVPPPTQD